MPFAIPDSWCIARIDDVAFVTKLAGFEYTDYIAHNLKDSGIPLFKGKNVQGGEIIYEFESYIPESVSDTLFRSQVTKKCLLTPYVGTIGNIGIHEKIGKFHLGSNVGKIEVFNTCKLNLLEEFVKYFLLSSIGYKELTKHKKATAQESISIDAIRDVYLPIPPLEEQKRIVAEIDKWYSLVDEIDNGKQDLQNYLKATKSKILSLAISGKLVTQDPNDEPAIELLRRINPSFVPCDTSHYENLPGSWAVCRLEDIVDYEQPTQYLVSSTNYSDVYETPVLTAGKSFILGYTKEKNGIYNNLPTIIFDDFTTDSRLVDFPFKVKSSAMKILQVNKEINIEYVSFFMSITRLIGDTHKRYWISEYSKLLIPIPPKSEQDRIVARVKHIELALQTINFQL